MTLKDRIKQELKNTGVANIDKMLQYMEQNGYYECNSHSHNNWKGGASQHMWAVYLIAKYLRDQRLKEPDIAKYATDEKLAIVCLLHDLCDMQVLVYMNGERVSRHGYKSYCIMKKLDVGTEAERKAVCNHMHEESPHHLSNPQAISEYNALHSLITKADHMASGTAWNSMRFKEGRSQHRGVPTDDISYLRAVAMDRSVQSGRKGCHFYVDETYELREFSNYNRDKIKWNFCKDTITQLNEGFKKVTLDSEQDVISAAHEHIKKTGERLCLVVGVSKHIPQDKDTRLRRRRPDEQDILICSNILNSFYESKECEEKGSRRYRFEFTMRDVIKKHYRELSAKKGCIYLPGVQMIRDGSSRGFPFIEPWEVDLLLVSGESFPMYAIALNENK